jgi:alkylation response protein AidB-like acyl-CoA dehydrogenase
MQSLFDHFCPDFSPNIDISLLTKNTANFHDSWRSFADTGFFQYFFPDDEENMETKWKKIIQSTVFLAYKMNDTGLLLSALFQVSGVMIPLNLLGSDYLKEKWLNPMKQGTRIAAHCLTEKNAGTDVLAMKTFVKSQEDNTLKINGEKMYICNSPFADVGLVYARNQENTKKARQDGLVTVLTDLKTKGVTVGTVLNKIGLHSVNMASIHFDDVTVKKDQILYKMDGGVHVMQIATTFERLLIPVAFLGIMIKIYDFCHSVSKKSTLTDIYLSEIYLQIFSGFSFLEKICKEIHLDKWKRNYMALACMVKIHLTETYLAVTNIAKKIVDILGVDKSSVDTEYRNALSAWIYSGTNDSLKSMLAKLI